MQGGYMENESKRNNRYEYAVQQTPSVKKADVNYFYTWLTDCRWYAKIQLPPPK